MPSSDINMISRVVRIVDRINPVSILDVGIGTGRYGFLFRECFDWNIGNLDPKSWKLQLYGVEIDQSYVTPIHEYLYTKIYLCDWLYCDIQRKFDLVFMGDVLEHWPEGQWQQALMKAREISKFTLVVAPNWKGSINQTSWHGHHQEKHWSVLSPEKVGGRCLFASSKMLMCAFDNHDTGLLEDRDICLF